MAADNQHIETLLVHGGRSDLPASAAGTPTVLPIYASTTYLHPSVEALDQAFSGTTPEGEPAFAYARQGNPNAKAFEDAIAAIENGKGAVSFGSGMAAIHAALLAAGLTSSTKIVASRDVYGPTINLLRKVFVPVGVEVVLADLCGPTAVDVIEKEQPDIIYTETLSNPLVKLCDLERIGAIAQEVGAISIIDSTFTPAYMVRPIEHGFDLVVHSATKYISGHGDSTGGVVISAKNTLLDQLRSYSMYLGAMLSPFESHLMLRGLRTMALRVERQCTNAMQVATFLHEHPAVERVHYPGLPTHPQHAIASKLFDHNLYGGLLSFELKEQSREAVFRFMNRLQLCLRGTTLGDVYTQLSYPPVSSHRTLSGEECSGMGITAGCIRVSIGIEHIEDIIRDMAQALEE